MCSLRSTSVLKRDSSNSHSIGTIPEKGNFHFREEMQFVLPFSHPFFLNTLIEKCCFPHSHLLPPPLEMLARKRYHLRLSPTLSVPACSCGRKFRS
jgi:hypothetical protein